MKLFKQKDIITQQIITDILDGKIHKHGKLFPASDLAKEYGISIVTMREILKAMESLGILTVNHGRGIFLNNPDTIFLDLFDTRIVIESSIAGLSAKNRTEEDIESLKYILADLKKASVEDDIDLYTEADYEFHFYIAETCKNVILKKTLENIRNFLHYQQLETNIKLLPSLDVSWEEHRLILEKIIEKDECGAIEAMKDHLNKTKKLWMK